MKDASTNEADVLEALRRIVDPELGINIVELGFVYSVRIEEGSVLVQMTLTTAGCPMHDALVEGARAVVRQLPGVSEALIELVWDPPWRPSMISRETREAMGLRP